MSDSDFYPVPHLAQITQANRDFKEFKRTYMDRARVEFEKQTAANRLRLDLAIRKAFEDGETKANLGRALETKDRRTLLEILERSKEVTTASRVTYKREGERLWATLTGYPLVGLGEGELASGTYPYIWTRHKDGDQTWEVDMEAEGFVVHHAFKVLDEAFKGNADFSFILNDKPEGADQ